MADNSDFNPLMSLFNAGTSMATGNPFGMFAAVAGVGLSIFGASEKSKFAEEQAGLQKEMIGTEFKQEGVRHEAMQLHARRMQMETLRNAQRARSLALNSATSQGAQFGSGLQGGYGQIAGAADWNLSGIQKNLNFGEQMFDLNRTLSQQKMQMADLQSSQATSQSYMSVGNSLLTNLGPLSNISKTMFKSSPTNMQDNA